MGSIKSLEIFPRRCPVIHFKTNKRDEMRQLIHGKGKSQYKIIFTIDEDKVYIIHVFHVSKPPTKFD
jgi:hypothetical protein